MYTTPPRVWRGQTHDDRTQARRAQLMQAGFELLGTEGVSGVTMRAVCRNARLSPRYFYESFRDTDELTLAVYDRCNSELVTVVADAADGAAAPVAAAIDAAAGYFEADPRRVRILLREPLSSHLLAGHRADVLPALLTDLASSAGVTDPMSDTTRALHASALSGALTALVLDWADGRLPVNRADLGAYATRLVLAGLR